MGGRERRWRWHRHKKEEEEEKGIDFSQSRVGYSRIDKDIILGGNAAKLGRNVVCKKSTVNHAFWELVVEFPEFSHTWYVPYMYFLGRIRCNLLWLSSSSLGWQGWGPFVGQGHEDKVKIYSAQKVKASRRDISSYQANMRTMGARAWAWWSFFAKGIAKKSKTLFRTYFALFANYGIYVFVFVNARSEILHVRIEPNWIRLPKQGGRGEGFWDGGWGKGWIKGLPAFLPALPAPYLNPRGASLSPPPMPPPPPPPVSASTLVWDDICQLLLERYSDVAKQIRMFELFQEKMWILNIWRKCVFWLDGRVK